MDRLPGDRVYSLPHAGGLRRRRRRNTGPPLGFILCLVVFNGALLYLVIQLWYFGLVKVFYKHDKNARVAAAAPFPGHVSRPNATKSPIFVVGLPKAGTSSLFEFFHCHGYYSQHWYCCRKQTAAQRGGPTYMSECMLYNLRFGLPMLQGCGDYDVYTELNGPRPSKPPPDQTQQKQKQQQQQQPRIFLPQHYNLQDLHDYAPDSTWILNIRPVDDWVESVLSVDGHMLLRQFIYEVQQHDPFETPKGRQESRDFLRRFWDKHLRQIYDFVQDHPSHTLVTVNISDPNAGLQLARSLGFKKEGRAMACWRQHNKREDEHA
jgi:hypothetical protein